MRPQIEPHRPDARAVERILVKDGRRVTYNQIAKNTGRHVTSICKIFTGARRPGLQSISSIASYLGVTIEELKAALKLPY